MFAAERRLLANALLNVANSWFVLLSESCIPIAPFDLAYKYITQSQHSFVQVYKDLGRGGRGRYLRLKNKEKLNPEISLEQWRKGSEWFEMSRELALIVVADRTYYKKFEDKFCRKEICYVDEHYLPTVLTILKPAKLANRSITLIDWSRSAAHPFEWTPNSISKSRLRRSVEGRNCTYNGQRSETCFLFSRKFRPDTLEPLLNLSSEVFGIP